MKIRTFKLKSYRCIDEGPLIKYMKTSLRPNMVCLATWNVREVISLSSEDFF